MRRLWASLLGGVSATIGALLLAVAGPAAAQFPFVKSLPLAAPDRVSFDVFEVDPADQETAEQLFAQAEAALWLPDLGTLRWLERPGARPVAARARATHLRAQTVGEFRSALEEDFPNFGIKAYGSYLLKVPDTRSRSFPRERAPLPVAPVPLGATVFTETFESGMGGWDVFNSNLDLYNWGATTCEAHTGSHSADAIRGGMNSLGCNDAYGPDTDTEMLHKMCEPMAGASQAWLEVYVHTATESTVDKLGFYYTDSGGQDFYGYTFSGSWAAWSRLVFNLKQWYVVGDVTAVPCPSLLVTFRSNATTQSGFGARVDDITVTTDTPSFLRCTASASPTSGASPLTVSFQGQVSGAAGGETYEWRFGDQAASTGTGVSASFTYQQQGEYWPRLIVRNAAGTTLATAQLKVTVTQGGGVSGDCDGDGRVSLGEVQRAVNMLLQVEVPGCGVDANHDGRVTVDELQRIVNSYLQGGSGGDVVNGPDGTSITLPSGARTTGAIPSLSAADGTGLADPGEVLVSSAVRLAVTGTEPAVGNGTFTFSIPVTGTVADPEKLLLKVLLADGTAYPVAGVYDATRRVLAVELMALWDGWKMGVVSSADLTTIPPTAAHQGIGTLGWQTPDDWRTCAFSVKNEVPKANPVPDLFARTTLPDAMKAVCSDLRTAEFRSPKLWVDTRLATPARIVHLVRNPSKIGSHWEPCFKDPPDPTCDETSPAFKTAGLTENQMLALGQMFINYDEIQSLGVKYGVTLENVAIHELTHAVQLGYDFRTRIDAAGNTHKAYSEGTATVIGHTYQGNPGWLLGGEVILRPWKRPLPLDERLDEYASEFYQRQDYFAYLAKRFSGGRLSNLRWLFQAMSDQTDGQFGLTHDGYLELYRKAMDFWLLQANGKGLSQVYGEYALDRAYRHPAYARLRPSETALRDNSFDGAVFKTSGSWDPQAQQTYALPAIPALATSTLSVTIPDAARTSGTLSLTVAVSNVALSPDGVRITIFRERGGAMLPSQGEIAVTDVSGPIAIPVGADVDGLRVFVSNGTLETRSAQVTFTAVLVQVSVSPGTVSLATGGTQQFTATVTGTPNTAVTWRVQEGTVGGTITSGGLYTAPDTAGTYHVVATSQADLTKSGTATVTVGQALSFDMAKAYFNGKFTWASSPPSGFSVGAECRQIGVSLPSGGYSGNTFSCTWDRTDQGLRQVDQVTWTLNAARDMVVTFSTSQKVYYLGSLVNDTAMTGVNLPKVASYTTDQDFRVDGAEACAHITSLRGVWDGKTFTGYSCNDSSFVTSLAISYKGTLPR